ncbi:MAG: hypothetical protein FWF23_00685 [Alphaproteobacteria bacterium]|nr:hypothetical protein [Alphaproteobacteria bacterium]MCL2505782.1 hypothetical protein [Alphaproteobacteria bacterium]
MNIEQEIKNIQFRNKRVELDKTWETSWTRKISIAIITYVFIVVVMLVLNMPSPFLNAIIPTCGFVLSTLGLNFIKKVWIKLNNKKPNI